MSHYSVEQSQNVDAAYQFAVQKDSRTADFCAGLCEATKLTGSKSTPRLSFSTTDGTIYAGFLPPLRVFGLSGTNCFAALVRITEADGSFKPPRPKHRPDKKSSRDSW